MICFNENDKKYFYKIFNGSGYILTKEQQDFIEYYILENNYYYKKINYKIGKTIKKNKLINSYLDYLYKISEKPLNKKEIVIKTAGTEPKILIDLLKKLNIKYKVLNKKNLDIIKELNNGSYEFGVQLNEELSTIKLFTKDGLVNNEFIAYLLSFNEGNLFLSEDMNFALDDVLEKSSIRHLRGNSYGELSVTNQMLENEFSFGADNNNYYFLSHITTADALLTIVKILDSICGKNLNKHLDFLVNPTKIVKVSCSEFNSKEFLEKLEICEGYLVYNGRITYRKGFDCVILKIESSNQKLTDEVYSELTR